MILNSLTISIVTAEEYFKIMAKDSSPSKAQL